MQKLFNWIICSDKFKQINKGNVLKKWPNYYLIMCGATHIKNYLSRVVNVVRFKNIIAANHCAELCAGAVYIHNLIVIYIIFQPLTHADIQCERGIRMKKGKNAIKN